MQLGNPARIRVAEFEGCSELCCPFINHGVILDVQQLSLQMLDLFINELQVLFDALRDRIDFCIGHSLSFWAGGKTDFAPGLIDGNRFFFFIRYIEIVLCQGKIGKLRIRASY